MILLKFDDLREDEEEMEETNYIYRCVLFHFFRFNKRFSGIFDISSLVQASERE